MTNSWRDLGIKAFQQRMLGKIKEEHGDDVILAMRSYGRLECLDFTILKPRAVVISDNFRAGMIHNRTNLIQSVPVVIFGNMLHYSKCESARISCDGRNALIEEL